MAKFLDTIKAFQYNDKVELDRIKPPKMLDLSQTTEANSTISYTYRIEARFATQMQITPDSVERAVEHTRREIAEYVYGEIHKELIEWFSSIICSNNIGYKECELFYKILDKMR